MVLKKKYTRDEDSAEMLDIIFRSGTYDLGLSVWPQVTYYKYSGPQLQTITQKNIVKNGN